MLWVLGWLFIFPVSLTILLVRNESMNKNLRVVLVVVGWLVYVIIGAVFIGFMERRPSPWNRVHFAS